MAPLEDATALRRGVSRWRLQQRRAWNSTGQARGISGCVVGFNSQRP